jgi:hypothetical protein
LGLRRVDRAWVGSVVSYPCDKNKSIVPKGRPDEAPEQLLVMKN